MQSSTWLATPATTPRARRWSSTRVFDVGYSTWSRDLNRLIASMWPPCGYAPQSGLLYASPFGLINTP